MNSSPAENHMRRALELAERGRGHVSPNPMVGCVIVHDLGPDATGRVLAEGWHEQYGGPHAEVNAIRAVAPADEALLPQSTAYVTLEPCSHWGKTPPCAKLLIERQIGRVVCCNDDPNPLVSGRGFQMLREAGIQVETGVLAPEGRLLNARFFTFMEQKRPYIILKWAETANGFISGPAGAPMAITGPEANALVHRWRAEEPAILVGSGTARHDNPRLNVRLYHDAKRLVRQPLRIVLDRMLTLPRHLHLFDGSQPTLVYHTNTMPSPPDGTNLTFAPLPEESTENTACSSGLSIQAMLHDLHGRSIQSVLVEGGNRVHSSFLNQGLWDEIRQFKSTQLVNTGTTAPLLPNHIQSDYSTNWVGNDQLYYYLSRLHDNRPV
ncbi:bifunctional diaminohydroxyphosphoribosylaminopyrimidine deaminase/5-amino-6-(5-phosphoribosylamino)uracil reductase RibD [Fibrella sp. HMF5335]|uniref:Riboflavin biosynthesis protein RibD n=1 Tax=Fibrella rubiginis TaxID=2817060 RepID=A0A939GL57_9BACT|nr:bifunctional diaminohydroxyphosphoribosylaminopyrimidine deaminase/5-amino-6-(5-phosphoribosylamino)uracil reductase RibD [Fibrella rubiginis]MBO0939440.1 bifunctional diaminohydroxyphosphoribosylaminopyrimidine deaminase/5-amino-6-(5-phosphoribosylamino)uracil reductase RibD [Fibrella rubiginis]